ncbi:MAG: Gfo/Idh/MocA family oxidoreductase [Candidatus Saccharibacteria bacterium]|nr:Gfo/Idh/MocA family oxidoreductase [Candidatus Saccharibacteria bacterium]
MIKVCIIGGGNISNTRHIPALRKLKNVEIVGVLGSNKKHVERTCREQGIKNSLIVNDPKNDIEKVQNCAWFSEVDAVSIGTPPKEHYPLSKMALLLDKDVLVEKPMTMNEKEAKELIALAKKRNKILNVVHNFNFTSGMKKINEIVETKKYGEIQSITEVQLTNRDRRLPTWYKELPMGLFFDEAAHFIYLLMRHGGELKIKNSYALYGADKEDNTPSLLSVDLLAGKVPTHMYLNFNSPVCEWYYCLCFKKRIIYYDLFKDILVDLPTDGEHYAKEVFKNDFSRGNQYRLGFIKNGFKMISKNLLYGHETVLAEFIKAIETRKENKYLSAEMGLKTVQKMSEIVEKGNKR